jgi:hypothetical protein
MIKTHDKVQYLANRARVWDTFVRQVELTSNNPLGMARAINSLGIGFAELWLHLEAAYRRYEHAECIDPLWVGDVMDEVRAIGVVFSWPSTVGR